MSNNCAIKYFKSVFLLGVITSLPNVFFKDDDNGVKLGLLIISICALHERGHERRPGSNFLSIIGQNVLPGPDAFYEKLQNSFFNVINGGGAVFDDAVATVNNFLKK